MLKYRIYYADGTTYQGDPFRAPIFGVLLVVEPDPEMGKRIVQAGDYYGWDTKNERWFPYDFAGLMDYLQTDGYKRVLIGRLVSNEDWIKIFEVAYNDEDFPKKTSDGRKMSKVR